MPFGKEVGLGPGHTVLDGDSALSSPSSEGHNPQPIFGSCLLWPLAKRSPISATAEHYIIQQCQPVTGCTRFDSKSQIPLR